MTSRYPQISFQILLTQEDNFWVAVCLDLDVVTASIDREEVLQDIRSLIQEQVNYCISNDNLYYLYNQTPELIRLEYENSKKVEYFKLYCSIVNEELVCGKLIS